MPIAHHIVFLTPLRQFWLIQFHFRLDPMFRANNWPTSCFVYSNVIQTECRRFSCHCQRIPYYALWNDSEPSSLMKKKSAIFLRGKKKRCAALIVQLISRGKYFLLLLVFILIFDPEKCRCKRRTNLRRLFTLSRPNNSAGTERKEKTQIVSLNYETIFIDQIYEMNVRLKTKNQRKKKSQRK